MLDFFNRLNRLASGRSAILDRVRFYSVFRFLVRRSANIVLPLYFRFTAKQERNRLRRQPLAHDAEGVVVSLTTFPGRIDTVWLAIETLLRQEVKPDALILWLSKDQFSDMSILPHSLLSLVDRGLRIELREGDLRSHKKYFFARREFPNATLVLADDDIFYPTTMLKNLIDLSCRYKGLVICRFAKKIRWAEGGGLLPYINWQKVNDVVVREDVFFGSGGGVLIPPEAIHEDLMNEHAFLENCPLADDIWLNAMCRLVSPKMVSTATPFSLLPVINSDKADLSSINNGEQMNDRQLAQVRQYCRKEHGVDPFLLK